MAAEHYTLKPEGNMRAPPLPTMAQWVLDSWHDVKDHVIVKSVKKFCISNAMDGSEDDILYADRFKEKEDKNEDDSEDVGDPTDPHEDNLSQHDWQRLEEHNVDDEIELENED